MRFDLHLLPMALLAAACAPDSPADRSLLLAVTDTLLRPAAGLVARPADIGVDAGGRLYLADAAEGLVVVLDAEGGFLDRVGRKGTGPGEMIAPRSLSVSGDTLRVVDDGTEQVHVFTPAGAYVRSFAGLPALSIAEVSFNASGNGLIARHGLGHAMAQRFAPSGALGASLGTPPTAPDMQFDFARGKADLVAGRIPPALRNFTAPVLGADGTAWVLHTVDGTVDRYSPGDSLLWTAALPDTLVTRLREGLFARTRQDSTTTGFVFPSVLIGGRAVGENVWILLQGDSGAPAEFVVLGRRGEWRQRITVSGASSIGSFAVDQSRGRLYLLNEGEGVLVRAALP